MSWSMIVSPLHAMGGDSFLEWAGQASFAYGVPDQMPVARESPTVQDILSAFRQADCHGLAWFQVRGLDQSLQLPPCPNPATCADDAGRDLGEVSLQADDGEGLELDTPVKAIAYRKPSGRAVLVATLALAAQAGPLVVFDDNGDKLFVVSTEHEPSQLAEHWPW